MNRLAGQILRISKIILENYRPYKNVELELSPDDKKSITVVMGSMSAGKTSLMNALQWCLYGQEPFFLNQGEGKPIINQKALNDTKLSKSCSAFVSVEFADEKGPRYIIKRTLTAYRRNDSSEKEYNKLAGGQVDIGFTFEVKVEFTGKKAAGNWETTSEEFEVASHVNRIIPKQLSEFVFFNGEMLDTFFREEGSSKVKVGIERVSGLPITQRSLENWQKMNRLYKSKAARSAGVDTAFIEDKRDEIEKRKTELVKQKNLLEKNIEELMPREKEIKSILQTYPEELIRHLREELVSEESHKIEYQQMMAKISEERRDFLVKHFAPLLLNSTVLDAYSIIKDSEVRGEIPPPINAGLLLEKIEEDECICGNDLSKDPDAKKKLQILLEQVKNSALAPIASEGKETLLFTSEIPNASDMIEKLNGIRDEYNRYKTSFAKTDEKISGITTKLQEHPEEKIRQLGIELEEIIIKKDKISDQKAALNVQINAADTTLQLYEDQINKSLKDSKASTRWKSKMDVAQKATNILEELREVLLTEIREDVERRTEEIWRKLVSRHWQLDKITIDPNYKIRVYDKEGVDNMRTLSAGQTLYLALSFIAAVREVTDTNYPMVIDSPFGKVSGRERVFAAEDLPTYLPGTQMTFLVTDSEYNAEIPDIETKERIPSIKSILGKNERVWKEYVLKLEKESETSSKTTIKEMTA